MILTVSRKHPHLMEAFLVEENTASEEIVRFLIREFPGKEVIVTDLNCHHPSRFRLDIEGKNSLYTETGEIIFFDYGNVLITDYLDFATFYNVDVEPL
jgi:hypothetical protein